MENTITILQQNTKVYSEGNHIKYLLVLIFMRDEAVIATLVIENNQWNYFDACYKYYQPLLN